MKTEFEIVFTDINKDEIIEKIKSLWWVQTKKNTLMKRVIFKHPWDSKGSYLRVRDEWDKITCTYKKQKPWKLDIYSIQELETIVWDFDIMVNIFRELGLKQKSYQETYREVWEINEEVEIMIDLWPGLKPYIELEAENEELVKKYSEKLWFNYNSWLFGTVFQVYEKELWFDYDFINWLKEITFENPPKKRNN